MLEASTSSDLPTTRSIATDYVHTVHPETGLEVVFVPGEALPDWIPTD